MQLTKEQHSIINSTGNIKINAVAGSGKTTTIIEYANARPKNSKILYLAFNKSVKLEAIKKFQQKGLTNVSVETAHSLAYKSIVFKNNYTLKPQGYKTYELVDLLNLKGNSEKLTEYVIANHINKFIAYFCNSDKQKVQELNYLDIVTSKETQKFVRSFYTYIEHQTRILLAKMNKGEIGITHDFYLKKYQLSNPILYYDYILFDEGQDASPAMLDVFLKQKATKVIVGDTHQQIYGWRHAVNSLEKTSFSIHQLSSSFRFVQDIAHLAMEVLEWKNILGDFKGIPIKGLGQSKECKSKAILARTNLGLLLNAINFVTENRLVKSIYFEGNINSYTYADEGASLYDVLKLYNGKHSQIRDKLIKKMKTLSDLEEYIEKTEDVQLGLMVEIVREYGNEIYGILKEIKNKHIDNDDKDKAEVIFSTVHRCKGMEYDEVYIVNDFITEDKIEKLKTDPKAVIDIPKLNEEINLLYVAITRAKNNVHIPESLLPTGFKTTKHIHPIEEEAKEEETVNSIFKKAFKKDLNPKFKPRKSYQAWTGRSDRKLTKLYYQDKSVAEIANELGRTKGAILVRVRNLGLDDI